MAIIAFPVPTLAEAFPNPGDDKKPYALNVRLDDELGPRLRRARDTTGTPAAAIIRAALRTHLDQLEATRKDNP